MQGFLIKIRYKPTWRVCSCFHVLLFKWRLELAWRTVVQSFTQREVACDGSVSVLWGVVVYQERWTG